jgi:predicted nucleic acid-binding protein
MIIVLDTNVLVSGLLTPFGSSGEIVRMVSSGKLTLEYDSRILIEYQEVRPLNKPLPDPGDAPFLEVAIEGKSKILITGNKVHYPVKFRKGIKVLSPTEFIKFYQKIRDSTKHRA